MDRPSSQTASNWSFSLHGQPACTAKRLQAAQSGPLIEKTHNVISADVLIWKRIKVAVVEYTNFTAIEADEHLQTANLSTEYRCPRELEAEKALQQVTHCHATPADVILIDNLNFL